MLPFDLMTLLAQAGYKKATGPEPDMTNRYNTPLTQQEEKEFSESGYNTPNHLQSYDMRGWWKANGKPNAKDHKGHWPDTYKKPNHPTFSDESIYSRGGLGRGGRWTKGDGDSWSFETGPGNLWTGEQLNRYFDEIEKNSKLTDKRPAGAVPARFMDTLMLMMGR